MSRSDRGLMGAGIFSLGGAFLIYVLYAILENVNKPWIDKPLFFGFFILPMSLMAFFLIGYGIYLIIKLAHS